MTGMPSLMPGRMIILCISAFEREKTRSQAEPATTQKQGVNKEEETPLKVPLR